MHHEIVTLTPNTKLKKQISKKNTQKSIEKMEEPKQKSWISLVWFGFYAHPQL